MNAEKIMRVFSENALQDHVFHSYILEGRHIKDLTDTAMYFVRALLCRDGSGKACGICADCKKAALRAHEDLIWISKEGSVSVDDVRMLQKHLSERSFSGGYRIAVIESAENITMPAQNKLLKILEEPPERAVIILMTVSAESLLKTVVSRCIRYILDDTGSLDELGRSEDSHARAVFSSIVALKSFYITAGLIESDCETTDAAMRLLDKLAVYAREDLLMGKLDIGTASAIIKCSETARMDIGRKLKTSYVMKNMILSIEKERKSRQK